ncbi:Isochorismatase-like protein [Xylariales sp. PMI_506]|nr:Isochorismatase-like protein [Xylariales sp. PMI_506]
MAVAQPNDVDFGKNYAVLNLDLMTVMVDLVRDSPEGQAFISNCSKWNDAVHQTSPRPLTVFSSLSFDSGERELAKGAPFTKLIEDFGSSFMTGSPGVQIAAEFKVDNQDILLQKTRWYAGSGNPLEQLLRAQNIDTVIISGITLSGVVMSTVYHLFDLDYNIYVISDNVLELPIDQTPGFANIMLSTLMPKMNIRVISVEEALEALSSS